MTSVFEADLGNPVHAAALVELIAQLSQSHDGRRQPMTSEERAALIPGLKRVPSKHLLLADFDEEICGVAVCFIQFSTFSAREMLRIHDLLVAPIIDDEASADSLSGPPFNVPERWDAHSSILKSQPRIRPRFGCIES